MVSDWPVAQPLAIQKPCYKLLLIDYKIDFVTISC